MHPRQTKKLVGRGEETIFQDFFIFILGLIGLYYGAKFITDGAAGIAKAMWISEFVVGATIVAFGTSLPELASSVSAMEIDGGHPGIVIGNVLGSNLANFGLAVGLVAIFYLMHLHREFIYNLRRRLGASSFCSIDRSQDPSP